MNKFRPSKADPQNENSENINKDQTIDSKLNKYRLKTNQIMVSLFIVFQGLTQFKLKLHSNE